MKRFCLNRKLVTFAISHIRYIKRLPCGDCLVVLGVFYTKSKGFLGKEKLISKYILGLMDCGHIYTTIQFLHTTILGIH